MKHHKRGRTLGMTKKGREALLRSLASSLILKEAITTTLARAKELRPFVERLITSSKRKTAVSRRAAAARLSGARSAVKKLHETIAPRYEARQGGYTRIIRLGRVGKRSTESARIELVS